MSQIKCPNCGTVFQVDESQYHESYNKFVMQNLKRN